MSEPVSSLDPQPSDSGRGFFPDLPDGVISQQAEGCAEAAFNPAGMEVEGPPPPLAVPGSGRRGLADAWTGLVLCLTINSVALAYSFQVVAFSDVKALMLCAGLALAVLGVLLRGGISWNGLGAFAPLWAGLLLAVGLALGPLEARVPARVVEDGVRFALLLSAAWLAFDLCEQRRWRAAFRGALIVSSVLAGALGLAQYVAWLPGFFPKFAGNDQPVYSVFGNQDLFGGYMALGLALVWPRMLSQRRSFWLYGAAFSLLVAALLISSSRSAWLAAGMGVLMSWPRKGVSAPRRNLALALAVFLVAILMQYAPDRTIQRVLNTFSADDDGGNLRLWYWAGAWRMFAASPWAGVGLGNFAYWSPHYQGAALAAPGGLRFAHDAVHTTDAHCEPLQLLAEAGLAGAIFIAWMLVRLGRRRGTEWGALAALLVFACLNRGFHSVPHALAFLFLAGILLARGRHMPLRPAQSAAPMLALVLLIGALSAATLWICVLPSVRIAAAEKAHVDGLDPKPLYEAALAHRWPSAEAREEYGMALWDAGDIEGAYAQFRLAQDGLDTGRLHLYLARAQERLGEVNGAVASYLACLWRWPSSVEAWNGLYALSGAEKRTWLLEHARHWGIATPAGVESLDMVPEQP